jgi:hypothetical protein
MVLKGVRPTEVVVRKDGKLHMGSTELPHSISIYCWRIENLDINSIFHAKQFFP